MPPTRQRVEHNTVVQRLSSTTQGADSGQLLFARQASDTSMSLACGVDGDLFVRPNSGTSFTLTHDIDGIVDGRITVTTAGTRVQMTATSTLCRKLDVVAETDNTGIVVVGASTVVAALATRRGIPLNAGDFYSMEIDELTRIWIDSTVSGDGVTFSYYT